LYNELITLISINEEQDGIDVLEGIPERVDLAAKALSVGMKETYEAMSVGLKPEIVFEIADHLDYNGQNAIEFEGKKYKVLRTYGKKTGNELEITVTRL